MNIEQAKRIPLADILLILGFRPTQQKNDESWYLSPLRNERTASFHVLERSNTWHDFGDGKGGDTIDLVRAYLETQGVGNDVSDALRWISNMYGLSPSIQPIKILEKSEKAPKLTVKNSGVLTHPALIRYIEKRGISRELARLHVKEVSVYNNETGKSSFAIGLRNEIGGWEIRNELFKGCVGKKNIAFIRGTVTKPSGIHIFEGFTDYLSALMYAKRQQFENDSLILTSLSCLKMGTPYIKGYGYKTAYTWMDNDEAGLAAKTSLADFLATEENLTHRPMNDVYAPHKDVNAWHMHKLGLSL